MVNRFSALAPELSAPSASELSTAAPHSSSTVAVPGTELQSAVAHADALIDQGAALAYWSSVSADDNGVLGGYPELSRADLQGSANFLAKLRRRGGAKKAMTAGDAGLMPRAVDCGAGIGRVTLGFLSRVAAEVDVVEPVAELTAVVKSGPSFAGLRAQGRIGRVYNVGLESWTPERRYSLIWVQWCIGQITDAQAVGFLRRAAAALDAGGWIVVKENLSTDARGLDVFDGTDSSITRTDERFRELFASAQLSVVATELQRGMPKAIYPIRSYALQPDGVER